MTIKLPHSVVGAVAGLGLLMAALAPAQAQSGKTPEQKMVAMGYEEINGKAPKPFGNYLNAVIVGKLVFVSTSGPQDVNGVFGKKNAFVKGRFGEKFKADKQGALLAEISCVRMLRFLKARIGQLSRVKRIVKISVNVLATPTFTNITKVANGCSDFLVKVFGKAGGVHARAIGGKITLPFGIAMEIDAIVELK